MNRRSALGYALVLVVSYVAHAHAQDDSTDTYTYRFADEQLYVTHGTFAGTIELGCEPRSAVQVQGLLYVACGVSGVVQIDVSNLTAPRIVGVSSVTGAAVGVSVRNGQVFVITAESNAPEALAPVAPFTLKLSPPAPPPAPVYTAPTTKPSIIAPKRTPGFETYLGATAFFGTQSTAGVGGLFAWAHANYRFEWPIVLRAELAPIGFAGPRINSVGLSKSSGGLGSVAAGHVLAGVDTRYFELAMGAGGATVNEPPRLDSANDFGAPLPLGGSSAPPTPAFSTTSPTFVQAIRLGVYDGLSFEFESAVLTADAVRFGFAHASFKIPVTSSVAVVLRGGGGNVGFAYADVALRVRLRGDNGRGTVALWMSGGAAHFGLDLCTTNPDPPFTSACKTAAITGPSLGLGLEWRPY